MSGESASPDEAVDLLAPLREELKAAPRDKAARLELNYLSGTEPEWMPALQLRRDAELDEQLEEHVKVMGGRPGKYTLRLKVAGKVVRSTTLRLTFAVPSAVPPAVMPVVVPERGAEVEPAKVVPLSQQLRELQRQQRELVEVAKEIVPAPAVAAEPDPTEEEEDDDDDEEEEESPPWWEKLLERAMESETVGEVAQGLVVKVSALLDAKTDSIIERNRLTALRIQRLGGPPPAAPASMNGHAAAPRVVGVERLHEPEGGEQ